MGRGGGRVDVTARSTGDGFGGRGWRGGLDGDDGVAPRVHAGVEEGEGVQEAGREGGFERVGEGSER